MYQLSSRKKETFIRGHSCTVLQNRVVGQRETIFPNTMFLYDFVTQCATLISFSFFVSFDLTMCDLVHDKETLLKIFVLHLNSLKHVEILSEI